MNQKSSPLNQPNSVSLVLTPDTVGPQICLFVLDATPQPFDTHYPAKLPCSVLTCRRLILLPSAAGKPCSIREPENENSRCNWSEPRMVARSA